MKYSVDVLVFKRNVCQTKEQLMAVASGLRVNLNASLLAMHVVGAQGIHLQVNELFECQHVCAFVLLLVYAPV
jgi:NO-binding membrane sensor protein with MHYT domain